MKPTALVFGCTGQDGSYLCKSLLVRGFRVVGISRKRNPILKRLEILEIKDEVHLISCDLQNQEHVNVILEKAR